MTQRISNQLTSKQTKYMSYGLLGAQILATVLFAFRPTQNVASWLMDAVGFGWMDVLTVILCKRNVNAVVSVILGTIVPPVILLIYIFCLALLFQF